MNPVCLFYKQEAIYLDSSYARLSWRMPGRLCLLLSAPDRDVCTGNGQAAVGVSSLVSLSEFLFFSCFRFRWQGHTQAREMSLFLLYISPHYASIVKTYALLRCLHLNGRITNKLTRKHLINDFFSSCFSMFRKPFVLVLGWVSQVHTIVPSGNCTAVTGSYPKKNVCKKFVTGRSIGIMNKWSATI